MSIDSQSLQNVLVGIGLIGGILVYSRTRLPRQTIRDLQTHSDVQDKAIKDLQEENKQHIKTIAELQGQIKVYKELPLRELADGIAKVVEITKENAVSNQHILETLQSSALALSKEKHDGGLLVKTHDGTPLEVNVK